jgi:hypothetical protein
MQEADTAAPTSAQTDDGAAAVRVIGSRAFLLQDGVWIETTFDPSAMETIKVQFASEDYFRLISEYPDLAEAFALGERVIAMGNGLAFEVTTEEQPPIDFDSLAA